MKGDPLAGSAQLQVWLDLNSGHMGLKSKSPDSSSSMPDPLENMEVHIPVTRIFKSLINRKHSEPDIGGKF